MCGAQTQDGVSREGGRILVSLNWTGSVPLPLRGQKYTANTIFRGLIKIETLEIFVNEDKEYDKIKR